ncbi:MAG: hypothetical protein KBF84_07135 [Candidatus Microthrix sp.]|nr:hypothetical protein [Candidatus Microthrix sp.]
MPNLDGVEATSQLAGPGVDDPLRVVVITTFDADEYVQTWWSKPGGDRYVGPRNQPSSHVADQPESGTRISARHQGESVHLVS